MSPKPQSMIGGEDNRFDTDARRYAEYLATPEGRLRSDLTFLNLCDFLPAGPEVSGLRALDLGGGTGSAAVRLAKLGMEVTLMDSSRAMLEVAERSILEAGMSEKVALRRGDISELAGLGNSFDVVLCHNVLEYVDDPGAVMRSAFSAMRDSSSILSILVRSQTGEVMKAALQAGDVTAAEHNLSVEWGQESLYGGKVRFFNARSTEAMLGEASFQIVGRRGVRVVSDYLPPEISRVKDYERILSLERRLGEREEFFGTARYMHFLARPLDKSSR